MENSFRFFPLWKRGMKGDLTAFQKPKLLRELENSEMSPARSSAHPEGLSRIRFKVIREAI
jgi:hypothetical protein